MWENQEDIAIAIGLELNTYWEETPKQFEKHIEVYKKKEEARAREMDMNNYNLGKYIAYAVNDPKKYPKKPFLEEKRDAGKRMSGEEMEEIMKRNTIILGGNIK